MASVSPDNASAFSLGIKTELDKGAFVNASLPSTEGSKKRRENQSLRKEKYANNIFEALIKYGHDEDFSPQMDTEFLPTDAPPGSSEKIEVLRRRVELGQPLWHRNDRNDFSGVSAGLVKVRK